MSLYTVKKVQPLGVVKVGACIGLVLGFLSALLNIYISLKMAGEIGQPMPSAAELALFVFPSTFLAMLTIILASFIAAIVYNFAADKFKCALVVELESKE